MATVQIVWEPYHLNDPADLADWGASGDPQFDQHVGGDDALRDGSDSTYLRISGTASGSGARSVATFHMRPTSAVAEGAPGTVVSASARIRWVGDGGANLGIIAPTSQLATDARWPSPETVAFDETALHQLGLYADFSGAESNGPHFMYFWGTPDESEVAHLYEVSVTVEYEVAPEATPLLRQRQVPHPARQRHVIPATRQRQIIP